MADANKSAATAAVIQHVILDSKALLPQAAIHYWIGDGMRWYTSLYHSTGRSSSLVSHFYIAKKCHTLTPLGTVSILYHFGDTACYLSKVTK